MCMCFINKMYCNRANFNYFVDSIIFLVPTPDVLDFSISYVGKFILITNLVHEDQGAWVKLEAPLSVIIMEYIMEYPTGNELYMDTFKPLLRKLTLDSTFVHILTITNMTSITRMFIPSLMKKNIADISTQ